MCLLDERMLMFVRLNNVFFMQFYVFLKLCLLDEIMFLHVIVILLDEMMFLHVIVILLDELIFMFF